MAEHEPVNLAIEDDVPRSTDDLVAYWVRTFDRWTSAAEQNTAPHEDDPSIESDPAA